ncbi:Disease resistance protein L6 [Linum grandiflorum]
MWNLAPWILEATMNSDEGEALQRSDAEAAGKVYRIDRSRKGSRFTCSTSAATPANLCAEGLLCDGLSSVSLSIHLLSSSSTDPPVPLPTGEYEVFLSFRGPDVRQTFADCLYNCLVRSKIRTFRDEEELQKGETIAPSLVKAITESKIYIPIFTQSYASSKWCLQELAEMVKCWKTGKGHLILPVFYLMDPRDVRHQDAGPYKEAFEQHSLKHDPKTVLEWMEALQEVGKMKGWHVTESNGQGGVIDQILNEVELHLRTNYTLVTDELVGIDFHVEKVVELLNLDSAGEKIVGICGMGGLGKTTLAKAVYDKVSTEFDRCCFLQDVREMLSKKDGIVTLQNKIISNILRNKSDAENSSDGMQVIKDRVCKYKLLVVLDDVDEMFQFEDILGKLGDFSIDSRFLITTRDARVLELFQECKLYELGEMNHDYALELFSRHAFGVDYPLEDYVTLSEEFVQVAAGLPLALKVIGSLLFHTDKRFWEAKLIELKEIPPIKVQERLKISYNELTYNEKQIFLDVACLFVGADQEIPFYMWRDCDFYPESTIRTLVKRCFLRITENKVFWIHDQIRDLGRAIVREESNENSYKRSRIWSNRDALYMLKTRQGSDCVEALRVDLEGEDYEFTNEEFKNLSRLRYLEVWNGRLAGNFKEVLPNIRCLRLYGCESVPTDLNLNSLAILDLQDCSVRDGWKGWKNIKGAGKLKVACVFDCYNLEKVPDLSSCRSLELLDFSGCMWMGGELDIGSFKNLRLLGARGTRITKLKGDIGMLQNLQEIDVGGTRLIEMPAGISKLSSLHSLDLTLTGDEKPYLTERLPDGLKCFSISLFSLPVLPSSLTYFDLRYCKNLHSLPNLANLISLKMLQLHDVGIQEIPGLGELKMLTSLAISDAPNLCNLDGLENLALLEELSVQVCWVLRKLPSLAKLTKLHKLEIGWCNNLAEIHGVGEICESLLHLDMRYCSSFADMDALQSMVNLETLILYELQFPKILPPSLSMFAKLKRLTISGNFLPSKGEDALEQFPDLSNLKNLKELEIQCCRELVDVTGVDRLESLELLDMSQCSSIRKLPDLCGLQKLKKLDVSWCTQLTEIKGLGRLESLEDLSFVGCESIKELPNLSGLKKLRSLYLKKCKRLKEVNGLEGLELLEELDTDKRLKVRHVLKSVARYGNQLLTQAVRWGSL